MKLMQITNTDKLVIRDALIEQIDKELKGTLSGDKTLTLKYKIADLFKLTKLPKYEPPLLSFTADAWLKMTQLVRHHTTEIAANGVVEVTEQGYLITDILVYPQHVSGVTCESTDDYGPWLFELPDDVFDKIRFQFHSHVNMSVTPSGVDEQHRENMISQIPDFYIFVIMNKRGEMNVQVYDKQKGVIFEDKDILFTVWMQDGESIGDWLIETDTMLRARPSAAPATATIAERQLDEQWDNWRDKYGGGQEY